MSTVIAFSTHLARPPGRTRSARARERDEAVAPVEPLVVILPVVRIERHEVNEDPREDDPGLYEGPGLRADGRKTV